MKTNTKTNLIQHATILFMKYGIKSVSMDDISRDMGISKKTLYVHVDNKRELVKLVIQNLINFEQAVCVDITKTATNALDEMLKISRHIIQFIGQMTPSFTYDLQKYYKASWKLIEKQHFSFIESMVKTNLKAGIKEKMYRANIDPEIMAKLYMAQAQLITNEDVFPSNKFEKVDLYKEMILTHLHGVASDKGLKLLKKNEHKYVLDAK